MINALLERFRKWLHQFRRDSVRQALVRYYGWTPAEITGQVISDVQAIAIKCGKYRFGAREIIAAYRLDANRDLRLIFSAVDWLREEGAHVTREMICWAIRNGKVK